MDPSLPPHPSVRCDTSDMLHIHQMFRAVFTRIPELVSRVPVGDGDRAAIVGAHIAEFSAALHRHHQTEDMLLWDDLEAKAPSCALHIGLMRRQHAEMARVLAELEEVVAAWQLSASAADRDRVLAVSEQLRDGIRAHFGDEETKILPTAATALSQREWDELARHGRAGVPRDRMFFQLGWLVDSLAPDDRREWMRRNLPPHVRVMWRFVGRKKFDAHRKSVVGSGS